MTKKPQDGKGHLQVFINCPFDKNYQRLFFAIVFTVHLLGFRPRCSIEFIGGTRLERVIEMIRGCKYRIHDISRIQRTGQLPRFNMPFELGLDIGIKEARKPRLKGKNLLILETDGYRFQQFISDLKEFEVAAHHNKVPEVINHVRNWLNGAKPKKKPFPDGKWLYAEYRKFRANLPKILKVSKELRGPVSDLTFNDYSYLAAEFIRTRHKKQSQ